MRGHLPPLLRPIEACNARQHVFTRSAGFSVPDVDRQMLALGQKCVSIIMQTMEEMEEPLVISQ